MKNNAVIVYEARGFDANQPKVKGRHVAGASFLEGLVRHGDIDAIHAFVLGENGPASLKADVERAALLRKRPGSVEARVIGKGRLPEIARVGTLFQPDPGIGNLAMRRRHTGQRQYSICGLTHTICSHSAIDAIADYLTAPVQHWDALICTSTSVRAAVETTLDTQADYLEARFGVRPKNLVQLPIIPLGLDAERFAALGNDAERRADLRARLGIDDGDLAILFFGRLAMHAKAHPHPMLLAAQRAHEILSKTPGAPRLHFIFTGQFPTEGIEAGVRALPPVACPDVAVHFLDGADPNLADGSWAAADMFMSLSDNIQESFGITPIEAMAAGLPCIVSDWDGYRDTVIEAETGFLAPTTIPPVGAGQILARSYHLDVISYDRYIGAASQMTAVSIESAAQAVVILARDPDRLRTMGQAARRRAMETYDWSRIIPAYQDLWHELSARRSHGTESAPPAPMAPVPTRIDPFLMFQKHATDVLDSNKRIRLVDAEALDRAASLSANTFAHGFMQGHAFLKRVVSVLVDWDDENDGLPSLADCHRATADVGLPDLIRALLWLAKYGVIALEDAG